VSKAARAGPAGRLQPDRRVASASTATTLGRVIFLAGPMLSMIDSSVVNVAVPVIVTGLHTTLAAASWAVSGYLLGLGGGLAATPWLARRFGTLRAYTGVLASFTLASACCALAPSVGVLIAARVVQGLVAAPMVPLAMGRLVSDSETRRNIPASFGIVFFAAPALGPALGGLLIGQFGWRSVFLVNLPVGLAALAGTVLAARAERSQPERSQPDTAAADPGARLDLRGLLLLGAGLALATYGASQGPAGGWFTTGSAPGWAAGLALILSYLGHARRLASHGGQPAVNLSLLGSPRRALILALECVASVVLFAVLFLAPVFLQDIQHHPAAVTGLVLLPQGVVMGLASWLGSIVVDRGRAQPAIVAWSVTGGLALLAVSTLGMLVLGPTTPLWLTAALLSGRGVALGLTIQPLVMALLGDLDRARIADGNTLFNIAERLAGSFGIALLATFYATRLRLTGSAVTAWHDCALVLAVMSVVGALAATALGTGKVTRVLVRR
jgi:EmrB/QacA subfamily drug resistance transporter